MDLVTITDVIEKRVALPRGLNYSLIGDDQFNMHIEEGFERDPEVTAFAGRLIGGYHEGGDSLLKTGNYLLPSRGSVPGLAIIMTDDDVSLTEGNIIRLVHYFPILQRDGSASVDYSKAHINGTGIVRGHPLTGKYLGWSVDQLLTEVYHPLFQSWKPADEAMMLEYAKEKGLELIDDHRKAKPPYPQR